MQKHIAIAGIGGSPGRTSRSNLDCDGLAEGERLGKIVVRTAD